MTRFADWILTILERKGASYKHSRDVYVYGLDLMIYTFLSTAGLLLIGALLGRPFETVLLVALFYTNQTHGGGFHASSHLKCFLTMVSGLLVFIASFGVSLSMWGYILLASISFILLFTHPLVLHQNKSFLAPKSSQLVRVARLVLSLEVVVFVIFLLIGDTRLIHSTAFALALCACSRMAAIKLKQGKSYS